MKKVAIVLAVLIILIFTSIGWLNVSYNSMIKLRNKVHEQKAQIENVLQGRIEKIPDLVASVERYVKHEEKVFIEVAEARSSLIDAINNGNAGEMAVANEKLETGLNTLVAIIAENYPELHSSQLFISLNDEISESVNRISQERRIFNKIVMEYNNKIETFPGMLYAKIWGFEKESFFEATEEARKTNVVNFN